MPSIEEARRLHEQRRAARLEWRKWYGLQRWKRLRADQLMREPLCAMCLKRGEVTPATVCDHVEQHGGDPMKFWGGPFQSLCKADHDATKQAEEREKW